jgi:hypothetical protein
MLEDELTEAEMVIVTDINETASELEKAIVKTPEKSFVEVNMRSFFERAALGLVAAYMYEKAGARLQDYSSYVGLSVLFESIMDIVGIANPSEWKDPKRPFGHENIKHCLRDDPGAIAGWTVGLVLGAYINRNYL